jgi:peptidoglycan hydrolase CwlO-like protein
VGWRQKLRKRIASLERVIEEHCKKLAEEQAKPQPNQRLIAYWEKEIRARQETVERLKRRLAR